MLRLWPLWPLWPLRSTWLATFVLAAWVARREGLLGPQAAH
jgi:hypothetical protein